MASYQGGKKDFEIGGAKKISEVSPRPPEFFLTFYIEILEHQGILSTERTF